MTPELLREYRFQRLHHHDGLGQRAEACLRYARASLQLHEAIDAGVASIEWAEDPDVSPWEFECPCCRDGLATGALQAFWCGLSIHGALMTSLGGIPMSSLDDPLRRIVESELASECSEALWYALWDVTDLWA